MVLWSLLLGKTGEIATNLCQLLNFVKLVMPTMLHFFGFTLISAMTVFFGTLSVENFCQSSHHLYEQTQQILSKYYIQGSILHTIGDVSMNKRHGSSLCRAHNLTGERQSYTI